MNEQDSQKISKPKLACRLCLNTLFSECAVQIFGDNDSSLDLQTLISKYVHLELNTDDTISTSICQDCFDHLEDFHRFYRNVDQKQKSLQQNIFKFLEVKCEVLEDEGVKNKDEIPLTDSLETIQSEEVDVDFEIKNESDPIEKADCSLISKLKTEEIDYSSDDDVPLTELYTVSEKKVNAKPRGPLTKRKRKTKLKEITMRKRPKYAQVTPYGPDAPHLIDCELDCDVCKSKIGNFEKLQQHFKDMHHSQKVYIICCSKKFMGRYIVRHLYRHSNPEMFKCSICDRQFQFPSNLKAHLKTKHAKSAKKEPMKCTFCDKLFKASKSFEKHIILHEKGEITDKPKAKGPAECDQCSKICKSENHLKIHRKAMHAIVLPFQCDACEEGFVTKEEEIHHQSVCKILALAKNTEDGLISQDKKRKEAICKVCFKIFPTMQRMRSHVEKKHENVKSYICDQCGKKFKLRESLENHQLRHQGIVEPPVQCETCGRWLKSKKSLRFHMYTHFSSVNKCTLCGHVSTTRTALKQHVRKIHRIKSNFHCQLCDKSFKEAVYLEEHMATHTGVNLYACPHCSKESRSRANMYAHVKRMHPEEWLKKQMDRPHDTTIKSQLIKIN